MRKRVYQVLKSLHYGDIVSVHTCKLDGMSARVRNEILVLRQIFSVQIITEESFVGRYAAYFLHTSDENIKRVERLLKTYEKKENQKVHK